MALYIQGCSIFDGVCEDGDRSVRSNLVDGNKIFSWIVLCDSPRANRRRLVFWVVRTLRQPFLLGFVRGIAWLDRTGTAFLSHFRDTFY